MLFGVMFIIFILAKWKPDFFFWLFFLFFFDPGGIFENYFGQKIFGPLNASDVFFFLMFVIFLSVEEKQSMLKSDESFKKIFSYLLFVAFYFTFIYGFVIPLYYGRESFLLFLQKNRLYFMALPLMYMVYFFATRSIEIFFKLLILISFIFLSLYLITLLTGIEIIPVMEIERFKGTGIIRKSMTSYGLIHWILYLGIIIYFIKRRTTLKVNSTIVYYCATLMAITILLTLTRREFITLIFYPLVIIFLISYSFKVARTVAVLKIVFPVFFIFILLSTLFPEYNEFVQETYRDIAYQILPSDSPGAEKDYRVIGKGDIKYVFQIFEEHRLFGIGGVPIIWENVVFSKQMGDTFAMALDAGGEVPIYGVLMHFGIIGTAFLIPVYLILIKFVISLIRELRKRILTYSKTNPIETIFIVFLISDVIVKFTANFYFLFGEFFAGHLMVGFCVNLGFLYSMSNKFLSNNNNLYNGLLSMQ